MKEKKVEKIRLSRHHKYKFLKFFSVLSVIISFLLCLSSHSETNLAYNDVTVDLENVDFKLPEDSLVAIPSFENCSIYFKSKKIPFENYELFYKQLNSGSWHKAFSPVVSPENDMLRGSIVNLRENTEYETSLVFDKSPEKSFSVKFKTLTSKHQVKKKVKLSNSTPPGKNIIITDSGNEKAWVKYTAEQILKAENKENAVITVKNSKYLIFEGLKLKGGTNGFSIENSDNIRIINCDISEFGRKGKRDFNKDGSFYYSKDHPRAGHGGIRIAKSGNILIERCYIHDPASRVESWKYGHPKGPRGIFVYYSLGGIVVRYNDIIGGDKKRFNDVIGGFTNGYKGSGFFRDSDIYGNMLIFGNDDAIELDGGQMNIRFYQNKIENCLCGISTGPCVLGPSYLYKNLIANLGDQNGKFNEALKNRYQRYDKGRIFFFNNTIYTDSVCYGFYQLDGLKYPRAECDTVYWNRKIKGFTRNNIFYSSSSIFRRSVSKRKNNFDYDLIYSNIPATMKAAEELIKENHWEKNGILGTPPNFKDVNTGNFNLKKNSPAIRAGVEVENFIPENKGCPPDIGAFQHTENIILPYRPIPLVIDKTQLNFKVLPKGKNKIEEKIVANINSEKKFSQDFKIRKNSGHDWFEVLPSEGTFSDKREITFTVKINTDKMKQPRKYRGLFLIRLRNGYSRPVSVYADVQGAPEKTKRKGFTSIYLEAEEAVLKNEYKIIENQNASNKKCVYFEKVDNPKPLRYEFSVPEKGKYTIMARIKSPHPVASHDSFFMALNEEPLEYKSLASSPLWTWSGINLEGSRRSGVKLFHFDKGKHIIKLLPRESLYLDMLLVTNDPLLMGE